MVWVSSAVALFVLCWRLGGLPLMDPDEGRNAEVGREMLGSGAWLVPTLDGLVYLDKPAFFFRAVAVALGGFGHEEWAARLPSALAGLLTLALLFAFCRGRYGDRTAALAVLVAATAPLFFGMARIVIMDTLLGLFVCAAVFAAVVAEERAAEGRDRERRGWYLLSALSAGLGTLVKGPVGFLVPALVVIGWAAGERVEGVERRRGFWRRLGAPLNLVVFLAVVLPWFLGVVHERPDFLYYGLVEESLRRFATGSFHRGQPFYYFLGVVAAGLFAWSLLLPEAMLLAWRRRSRLSPTDRLFAVWSLVVVVFFSLSQSKQPAYILTAVVAQAALLARLLASALAAPAGAPGRAVLRGGVAAAVLYALAAAALLVLLFRPELLVGPGRQGMTPGWLASPALLTPLAESALALVGGSVLGLAGRLRREPRLTVAALSLLPLVLFCPGFDLLRGYAGTRSSRPLAVQVAALSGHRAGHPGSPPPSASGGPTAGAPVAPAEPSPGDLSLSGPLEGVVAPAGREGDSWEIACLACFPAGLPYYLERPVVVLDADAGSDELRSNYILFMQRRGRSATGPAAAPAQGGETEEVLVPSRRLESWLAAHTRRRAVLVLARRQRLARLARLVQVADLAEAARPPLDQRDPRGRPGSAAAPAPGPPGSSRREAGSVDLVQLTPGWWGALLPAGAFSDAFSEKSSVTGGAHGGGS